MHAKSLQSCLTLCDPMDCSLPGSSAHGDSPGKNTRVSCQCPSPGDLSDPGIKPVSLTSPVLASGFQLLINMFWLFVTRKLVSSG